MMLFAQTQDYWHIGGGPAMVVAVCTAIGCGTSLLNWNKRRMRDKVSEAEAARLLAESSSAQIAADAEKRLLARQLADAQLKDVEMLKGKADNTLNMMLAQNQTLEQIKINTTDQTTKMTEHEKQDDGRFEKINERLDEHGKILTSINQKLGAFGHQPRTRKQT